ncbi:Noc2p family-domain-containing protein [Neohortaea acidophila]|uniref:Noc2p family-domain-containing protein n=1 Tax=Neohortaea acidophila TaxID=245834 RepID=A0A6A6PUS3_9PEZI|nr:Noc2p family-domain-containing protein [Neohortaea acidophila]KAF2483732.1 Noc2p family-domain-containing protein [Neohortaea acidophila]
MLHWQVKRWTWTRRCHDDPAGKTSANQKFPGLELFFESSSQTAVHPPTHTTMAQTKATKKFEKRHLKDTLEKRNGFKKIKQRQQVKAKKKARRAEEHGEPEPRKAAPNSVSKEAKEKLQSMSVDEFFQGGFEVPELPKNGSKRKRSQQVEEDEESDASFEQEPVPQDDDVDDMSEEDDLEDHEQQLQALAQNDPEFHKYLQDNEPELLDVNLDELEGLNDDEEPKRKKSRKSKDMDADESGEEPEAKNNELTKATIRKWASALTTQHSLRTAREVILAFRAAAHVSDDDEQGFKYSVSDPQVYHELLTLALKQIPAVFEHHLPVQENKHGKVHVATESKKFKTITPLLRSHVGSILHLLDHLSDPATLRLTLSCTLPLLPYLLSFKKLVRDMTKGVTNVWSLTSNTEATRIAAFLLLRRLMVIGDPGIRENVLKAIYQALVKGSRNTTIHTLAGVNLMKNSASELWGLDGSVGYTTAFTFIRQLAIHLRNSIQNNAKESYKAVYNWQYVHSLDFWSRVLSAHCTASDAPLRPLIYPLVQVTLGAMRLIPTATYFPLRFQLIRSLLRLSRATGTYIPLAAPIYEVLTSGEMRKVPKPATLKPLDFSTAIRAPKAYLHTRTYQDGTGEQVQELLAEFLVLWSKNIAFPELSLPVTVMLKRWLKDVNSREFGKGNKNPRVNGMVSLVVQKAEANAKWVEERRAKVEFAPNDRKGVEAFLREVEWEKTPIGAFVVGLRRTKEEKEKVLEQARRDEEKKGQDERNAKEKEKVSNGRIEESDVDSEEDEDEEAEEMSEAEDLDDDFTNDEDEEVEGEDLLIDGDE